MDALTALLTRTSPVKLTGPGPTRVELRGMLEAALRAPDHGRLRPWRFIVVTGPARERLGEVLAEALRRRDPGAPEPLLQKERGKPLRAPVVVVVVASVVPDHPKIPRVEQLISAGTAAQNLQLAAHATGFGCMWRTGPAAYDPAVKNALGLAASDEIVGFMHIGNVDTPGVAKPAHAEAHIVDWPPDS